MIHSISSIKQVSRRAHEAGQHIVLATGFFDLLHAEHKSFLGKAKAKGDVLIVAVESDARARALKGAGRPVEPQVTRCQNILNLDVVDYAVALGDDFNTFAAYESLIAAVVPDTYAVSSHTTHQKNKQFLIEKYGGSLEIVHEFNHEISTTQIINQQKQL
jgi:D-beta-D-heptose 7-phosphate kinase/D-beta-D-heptose 1-phosphate adenosyltransferase